MPRGFFRKFSPEGYIAVIYGLIYLLIPSKMYYIDGVYYAEHLENMPWYLNSFHPHHLLYLPLAHLFYELFHLLIPSLRAMTFLQVTNSIIGAMTIWIFGLVLRRIGLGKIARIYSMMLLGGAYTFWHHSTDANIYIIAHFICLLTVLMVLSDKFADSAKLQLTTGVILGFAVLLHEVSLAMVLPLGIYIFVLKEKTYRQTLIRFLLPIILLSAISYPLVFMLNHGDTPSTTANFFRWITAFGKAEHYFTVSGEHAGGAIESIVRGHAHAFFPLKSLERILYDQKSGDTAARLGLYKYFLSLTFISYLIFIWILGITNLKIKKERGLLFAVIFPVYFIITSLFMPENHFYRIFYLPSIITIWATTISSLPATYRNILKPIIGGIIAFFLINNLIIGIIPESKEINNPYLAATRLIDKFATDDDAVIFASRDRYFTGIYRYFGNGDALHLQTGKHFLGYDEMMKDIDKYESETLLMLRQRYRSIFISREAVESKIDPIIFTPNNYRLPHPDYMLVRRKHMSISNWHQAGELYFAELTTEDL